jgi:hypothetical protein
MNMLYSQLGVTPEILNGTASEDAMINYSTRTVEPILAAIVDEMKRKFLTKTARTQGHSIIFSSEPFKLVPASKIADIAEKFVGNEVLTPNEVRSVIGFKPADDPKADELRNRRLNQDDITEGAVPVNQNGSEKEEKQLSEDNIAQMTISELNRLLKSPNTA